MLFVQSAGNQNTDSCSLTSTAAGTAAYKTSAYAQSTAVDGIVVVGAIDNTGAAVSGSSKSFAASEPAATTGSGGGSNYGGCVDMWAPGQMIYSTWGYGLFSTSGNAVYSGGQPSSYMPPQAWYGGNAGYGGWAWLSGTSMAAPHVAAAAAYLADKYNLTTRIAIENALR